MTTEPTAGDAAPTEPPAIRTEWTAQSPGARGCRRAPRGA
jgi:hypothetical protein